jgi:hypothetical protein
MNAAVTSKMLTFVLALTFLTWSVTASEAYFQVEGAIIPRTETCGPSTTGCEACGKNYVACGANACFNPSIGETCCNSQCKSFTNFASSNPPANIFSRLSLQLHLRRQRRHLQTSQHNRYH